jgi:hypothetical protein
MSNDIDSRDATIIDLDADQVVENRDPLREHDPEPSPRKSTPRRSNLPLLAAALLAGAIGGGFLYRDVLANYLPSNHMQQLTEKLAVLEQENRATKDQLALVDKLSVQLKNDVDALEGKQEALSGLADAVQKADAATVGRFASVEQSIAEAKQEFATLAARPPPPAGTVAAPDQSALIALQQRIDALEKDVAILKVKPPEVPDTTAALSQNLSDLKAKIASGVSYADELERIQRMVPAAAGLDVLQQQSATGVPDAKALAVDLRALIPDLPKPIVPGPVPESEGWWASIYNNLSNLIIIRVEGDVDWPSAAAAAVALADAGDLPQAIEQLNRIEGEKPAGIRQWMDRAQARLGIESALQSVEEAVLRVMAAKG